MDPDVPLMTTPNLLWGSIPPRGFHKRAARVIFSIPVDISERILPSPVLSLKELTDFPLPPQSMKPPPNSGTATQSSFGLESYFSKTTPSELSATIILKIRHLRIPETSHIKKLEEFSRQAWLDGFQSVCYAHLQDGATTVTYFPLWLITFWNSVLDVKKISTKWIKSRDWITAQLRQRKSIERRTLAQTASIMLTNLPWGHLRPKGFSEGGDPIHTLWRLLGSNWLASAEQDDLLELVRGKILETPESCARYGVQNTYFTKRLIDAFDSADYHTNKSFGWMRSLGEDIANEGSTLITVAHLGVVTKNMHWVPLIIRKGEISYGDSFGTGMPDKLELACRWWLQQHEAQVTPVILCRLSVTPQLDGDSCGILADNALQHFVDPINTPLLDSQPGSIIEQHLRVFNAIAQNIIARVSLHHKFTSQSMLTQPKLNDCPDEDDDPTPATEDSASDDDEPILMDQSSPGLPDQPSFTFSHPLPASPPLVPVLPLPQTG
jgi:hypothetical protein